MQPFHRLFLSLLALCPAWGQPPAREITQYLALTDAQRAKINAQNAAFNEWQGSKIFRLLEIGSEIDEETKKSPLDPAALGIRYAEVETIRRQYDERNAQSTAENIDVLSEAQKAKLAALEASQKLLPVAAEAQSAYLLLPDPPTCTGVPTLSLSPIPTNNCGPVIYDPFQGSTPGIFLIPLFSEQIRAYLSLTSGQLQILSKHHADFQQWQQIKQRRIAVVQAEISAETARSPLDPAALGLRYVEIEVIQREIADHEKQVLTANLGLLNESQLAKRKVLEEALQLRPASFDALALRLIKPACDSTVNIRPGSVSITFGCFLTPQIRGGIFSAPNPLP